MLLAIAVYLAAHCAAYLFVLCHRAELRSEKGISMYHVASAVFAGLAGVVFAVLEPDRFGLSGLVLVLSLHGIYSLSFLDLWSLAQGGYSLSIIASVSQAEASGTERNFLALAAIGEARQDDRVAALVRLGLVSARLGAPMGVGLFAQQKGWQKVERVEEVPTSHRQGSLFISRADRMPWPSSR